MANLNTYWNENGKLQEVANKILEQVPTYGYTNNKYMNLFVAATKMYYDYYNNDCCNLKHNIIYDINDHIKPFAKELKGINVEVAYPTLRRNIRNEAKLEAFMDSVIELVGKNSYDYEAFTMWVDFENNTYSLNELEGSKVTFGDEGEFNKYINFKKSTGCREI